MSLAVDIVKNDGTSQRFDRNKLHSSIVAVCISVRAPQGHAENTAHIVCDAVVVWLNDRPEVTSADIRTVAGKHLKRYHPEAAYLYEQHHIII
ncbi:MAG: ATP cone domain-containing protein [Candidatus Saccharibacteria bacterium]